MEMCEAGCGGYLALVVKEIPNGTIPIKIRREDWYMVF